MKIEVHPIGKVINAIDELTAPDIIREQESIIELEEKFLLGLKDVSNNKYIDIVFYFDSNHEEVLRINTKSAQDTGIFATRAPSRPNHIGITTVELLKVEGTQLHVKGLDAINNTPMLDIKPCNTTRYDEEQIHKSIIGEHPRIDIERCIRSSNHDDLLYKAGQLHGHICPGIALGVQCGAEMMNRIWERGEDTYDYTVTAEQANCVLDGMMFATGFTLGRKQLKLEYGDRLRFFFVNKEGKGWEVEYTDENRAFVNDQLPEELSKLERGLRVLRMDINRIFKITEII